MESNRDSGTETDDEAIRFQTVLQNSHGLHARPAAQLVSLCNRFESNITIHRDSLVADAKTILDVMMLQAEQGNAITVFVKGPDAKEASRAIQRLVANSFEECPQQCSQSDADSPPM